jgi:hypothetical protein
MKKNNTPHPSTPLVLHPKQATVWRDPRRHQFILAGRRGGKTILVRERLLERSYYAPGNAEVFYCGPTLTDSKGLIWGPLEERLDQLKWRHRPLISKHYFELTEGRKLWVIGAEKIRKVRGHAAFFFALDEIAFYDTPLTEVWKAVRPTLTDLRGRSMWTTTPNGKGTDAYDFYRNILSQPEHWGYHSWGSVDNPHMDRKEIEEAKHDLDEKAFRQEYEATWESFEGLAYYNFQEDKHIRHCKDLDHNVAVDLLMDFNVNPTTLLIAQYVDRIRVRREYSQKNSSTISTMRSFCADHKHLKDRIRLRIFGDAAGHSRASQTGFSDYHYVKQALDAEGFRFEMCVSASNPPIIDRVTHVNSWLLNYYGESRIHIDPSCTELIRDLAAQELDGRHPSPKNNLGHKADALGYYVHWNHMQATRRKQGTVQL